MSYLYKNTFESVYEADIGEIVKIKDSKSEFNNKLMYEQSGTFNGYCYKDYNNFYNHPDEICYIAECDDNDKLLVDFVNENKDRLIKEGAFSTANSIKEEIRNYLQYEEYYYRYQRDSVVRTIKAKDFDDEMIDKFAENVFDIVDWQCTSSYIAESDWKDDIEDYYEKKLNDRGLEV